MTTPQPNWSILLEKGNLYRTRIEIDGERVSLSQPKLAPAIAVGAFGVMLFFMSPWLGTPLLVAAALLLLWSKQIHIDTRTGEVRAHTGVPPLLRRFEGTTSDTDRVQLREVATTKNIDSTAQGKWRIWDVEIVGFDEKFSFSVWEEGDEEKVGRVAEAVADILQCPLETVTTN